MVYLGVLKIYRNIIENVHGKICVRDILYTGKNQEQYMGRNTDNLPFRYLWVMSGWGGAEGEAGYYPSVFKDLLWGFFPGVKGARYI